MPKHDEPDPQELLPSELRRTWAVVPQAVLYQLFVVGALIGAGVSVSIVGFVVGSRWMWLGFPISLAVAQVLNMVVPWTRRANRELEQTLLGDGAPEDEGIPR